MKTIEDVIKELEELGFVERSSMKEATKFVYHKTYTPLDCSQLEFLEINSIWRWKYILGANGKLRMFLDDCNTTDLLLTDEMSIADIMVLYK